MEEVEEPGLEKGEKKKRPNLADLRTEIWKENSLGEQQHMEWRCLLRGRDKKGLALGHSLIDNW